MSSVRYAFLEEQQVGADARVRSEDAVGQPHDRVQVAFGEQRLLEARLHALPEQRTIGQHHRRASALLQQPHDQGQEQVGSLAGPILLGKVALDAHLLLPPERRVGEDDVDAVVRAVAYLMYGRASSTLLGVSLPLIRILV